MAKLSDADKKLIDDMHSNGNTLAKITSNFTNVSSATIWAYIHRDIVKQRNRDRWARKNKLSYLPSTQKYVPTGRPMPPANPPSMMTMIIDKDLAELACKQLGIGSPVTTLKNRPHSISSCGMVWTGEKWIPRPYVEYRTINQL